MGKQALLLVISSPSGTGKTTIAEKLLSRHPEFMKSVSFTTRDKRKGEKEGKDYSFLSREAFLKKIKKGELIEWAEVYESYYGTPQKFVRKALREKKVLLMVLDVRGGLEIKRKYPQSVLVFVLPPSFTELKRRMRKRGAEVKNLQDLRLNAALKEIRFLPNYDYVVVNSNLNQTVNLIESIILTQLHKTSRFDFKNWKKSLIHKGIKK
ncbi:MAG: guanylate kinase [Candidatus Zixiibacteriota bacterium]